MDESEMYNDLVCPLGKFELIREGDFLICKNCGVKYPVIDDIPVLLIDDAILPGGITSYEELKCLKK